MKYRGHDVCLEDDGTLDTVISVDGCEHRFTQCDPDDIDDNHSQRNLDGSLRVSAHGIPHAFVDAVEDHEEFCDEAPEAA